MADVANVNDLLAGHVTLEVECLDRLYLNGYVPNLQVSGQVVTFLCEHRGAKVPSPALFNKIGLAFRKAVLEFAEVNDIPLIRFAKADRKIDVVRPYLEAASEPGVVAIGMAQEFQSVFTGHDLTAGQPGPPRYSLRQGRSAGQRLLLLHLGRRVRARVHQDVHLLPVSGQGVAERARVGQAAGHHAPGSASPSWPTGSGPVTTRSPCRRSVIGSARPTSRRSSSGGWRSSRPRSTTPIGPAATGGSCRCAKSRRPARSCSISPAAAGPSSKPSSLTTSASAGPRRCGSSSGATSTSNTKGTFRTRVVTRGVDVCMDVNYRDSRIKQYLKEGRALRIETVVNAPGDLGCQRRLRNLDELQAKARAANARLLAVQKAGQDCAISTSLFEHVAQPSIQEGQRVSALRFGDPRVMALTGALCVLVHTVVGFTNRSLCAQVSSLLDGPYTSTQTTYDLRRLRLKGLIRRLDGTNRYLLTPEGVRVAAFYTKVHHRLLGPLLAADQPPAPIELRRALRVIDHAVDDYITHARIRPAA